MGALKKAELQELDSDFKDQINKEERTVQVQFNPETLKVSYANQVKEPSGSGDQSGSPAKLFVGSGTTKLSVQIWFDVTNEGATVSDVRELTGKVAYFITPKAEGKSFKPPAVRFLWGTFKFDGIMDSLEESLEFFSEDGRPLRASMTFSLSQQQILFIPPEQSSPMQRAGTRPYTAATQGPSGSSVQSMAAANGQGNNWKGIAAGNGIENPRLLAPGQLVDLNAGVSVGIGGSIGVSGGVSGGISGGISVGVGGGVGGSVGGGVGGGFGVGGGG